MMGQLVADGHQLTHQPSEADVIVVNTCSFIDPAKQESVDTILEMAEYKKTGQAQRLVVAGCLVERFRNDIQKDIPEVDAVVGPIELKNILQAAGINVGEGNVGRGGHARPSEQSSDSPFVIIGARAEGDAREAAGRFSREN